MTQVETAHDRAHLQALSPVSKDKGSPRTRYLPSSTVSLEPHCPLLLRVDRAGRSELRLPPDPEKPVINCGVFWPRLRHTGSQANSGLGLCLRRYPVWWEGVLSQYKSWGENTYTQSQRFGAQESPEGASIPAACPNPYGTGTCSPQGHRSLQGSSSSQSTGSYLLRPASLSIDLECSILLPYW